MTMSTRVYHPGGAVARFWDDATRTYKTYSTSGAQTSTRPYTAEENARADAEAALDAADSNQRTIEVALDASLVDLNTIAESTANATINQNPASYIKAIARILRRVIRLLIRRLDGTA
jgi:hypothetical protein